MAHVTDDRILETTTTTGTGALTLAGAVAGFRAFSAKMTSPSDTCFYMIEAVDVNGIPTGDFETGLGTYSAASTLTRTTVSRSSNADAIVTLVAGTKRVAIVDIASTAFTATTAPILPIAGQVNIGERTLAGADMLSMRNAQQIERQLQPLLSRSRFFGVFGTGGTLNFYGIGNIQSNGVNGYTIANTNAFTRTPAVICQSSATAGTLTGIYQNYSAQLLIGDGAGNSGFFYSAKFGIADTVSGARMFFGVAGTNAGLSNVNPAALTNVIGIGQIDGSNNLNIVFGGSTAQTPIDLGVNYPANTNSTDIYELLMFSNPNDNTKVGYRVIRNNGAFDTGNQSITNTTPGTTLPATSTGLWGTRCWRTNNATAAAASMIVSHITCMTES